MHGLALARASSTTTTICDCEQGGDLLLGGVEKVLGLSALPRAVAPLLFTGLFGGALAFGNRKLLDQV
jgi:hypothetical protein